MNSKEPASKLVSQLKCLTFIMLALFSSNLRAEYYLVYPATEILPGCSYCYPEPRHLWPRHRLHHSTHTVKKHHYVHHRARSRNHYKIEVYYPAPQCPCGGNECCGNPCSGKWITVQHTRSDGDFVNFSTKPYYSRRGRELDTTHYNTYNLDRATADDDPYKYPDMNIDR